MQCINEKECEIMQMVRKVAADNKVSEEKVMEALKKWVENYSKGEVVNSL